MTRHSRSNRTTARATFLAAMMVLSVVAMSSAFAGAAAASDGVEYSHDDTWQGQDVTVQGTAIEPNTAYSLERVDEFDGDDVSSTTFVREVVADDDGVVTIDTDDLERGDYTLDVDGVEPVREHTFYLDVQVLGASVDADEVTNAGDESTTDLEIESNRGFYSVNVSANGDLDAEELFAIVADEDDLEEALESENRVTVEDDELVPGESQFGPFGASLYATDEDDADETIVLVDTQDTEEPVSFADVDGGEYAFAFESVDSAAATGASITVADDDVGAAFDQRVYTQAAGDVVEFTVDLEDADNAYLQLGDENANFVDVFYLEDDDDSGDVTFVLNTRTAGAPGASAGDVVHSEDDIVQSLVHGGGDEVESAAFYADEGDPANELEGGFAAYLEELEVLSSGNDVDEQLTRPLQPTEYSLTASANGEFVVENGESGVDDEIGYATLELVQPRLDAVSTHVAPGDAADEDDLEELRDHLTERADVADGDRLVIDAEATGLSGAMVAHEGDWDALEDGFSATTLHEVTELEGEGVVFDVEALGATGNENPATLDLTADDEDVFVFVDPEAGELFVVVDTDSSAAFDRSVDFGDEFAVDVAYETDADERYEFGSGAFDGGAGGGDDPAFPTLPADADQAVSTTVAVVEPAATFHNVDETDHVQIAVGDDVVLTGETNVAPGSDAMVRLSDAGETASFLLNTDAEVEADGHLETDPFDVSERTAGDETSIQLRVGTETITVADGIFVDVLEESDDEPVEGDDEPVESDDEPAEGDDEPAETDDEPVESDDEPVESDDGPTETDDSIPGFGVAVALVALLAVALVAIRRQG
ncbi:BGTF surface domain-containing protein [Natrialba sp. INN-245]|uniref:BGTF surface domain-containing protein n=1 Tax=Natrialba sp. INN-245 TaxID=2690967 RepID=UPI00135B4AFC|nr:BGTF surface domain-containing protein [Natrialba sp. INN-245]